MLRVDLQNILSGLGIPWRDEAKAVNINCPFCIGRRSGLPDCKYRCGVFPRTLTFHCFRCHRKGSFFRVLEQLLGFSRDQYESLLGKLGIERKEDESLVDAVRNRLKPKLQETQLKLERISLPPASPMESGLVACYPELKVFLESRKIDITTCFEYEARYTGIVGAYAYRIVVPIYDKDDRFVAWQARSVVGDRKTKYLSKGPVGKCLYWTHFCKPPYRIYLVEGIFDAWRMEYNAVASFTKGLTAEQRSQLLTDPLVDEVVFAWDPDAYDLGLAAAREFRAIRENVGIVRLPEGTDPDSLGEAAVRSLEVKWL